VSHLRFADDIAIMAKTLQDLQLMLNDLADSSGRIGLRMNLDKTKAMLNKRITGNDSDLRSRPRSCTKICLPRANIAVR
jgi:hypothetical protein